MAKILVVDDSSSMRQMIKFSLQSAGHTVTEAGDGKAGLLVVQNGQFDLILTDLNMPIMNGFEFSKEVRKLSNFKYTPILMLTTESDSGKKRLGKAAGVTGWIVKPFKPEKLLATVNKLA
ncbi:MAG: two-component system chemotaxis response regulator CheY [Enterobacterales bacterium]|jgi:two-component system chemotaxis response regulator CheY